MNPAEQAVAVEDDLSARIRIFNPIRPIPRIVVVRVEPGATFKAIVARAADKNVFLCAPTERIVHNAALQPIVVRSSTQGIIAALPKQHIIAGITIEIVPDNVAVEDVVAALAVENVVPRFSQQQIVSRHAAEIANVVLVKSAAVSAPGR